jgi:hypothetical protein
VSETISLPALQSAVENLRRRASDMSPIEKCKLRTLEDNLRIIRDHQFAERADLLLVRFSAAAYIMQANAKAAGEIAHAMRLSNRLIAETSRVAILRSRVVIGPKRA